MSKLQQLYDALDKFKVLGVELPENVLKQADQIEQDIIRKEILPLLSQTIEPALSQVKRELVLVVDYVPDQPIKVSLSRRKNISEILTDAVTLSAPAVSSSTDIAKNSLPKPAPATPENVKVKKGFAVIFNDGSVIYENTAKNTMIETFRHMGLENVALYTGSLFAGYPVVTKEHRTDGNYDWQECVDGWWIYTIMSNDRKISLIKEVAKFLKLKVKIKKS